MKKKAGKKITERKTNVQSKGIKQKIKQVVNVNIQTGRKGKSSTSKQSQGSKGLAAPYFAPSFNSTFQSTPTSTPDILTLANLLRGTRTPELSEGKAYETIKIPEKVKPIKLYDQSNLLMADINNMINDINQSNKTPGRKGLTPDRPKPADNQELRIVKPKITPKRTRRTDKEMSEARAMEQEDFEYIYI
jgi:hypothetical protein